MKIENGLRYQETEIVSYVQVINKAEIDRYLQRGKRKVCVIARVGCVWGCSSLKIRNEHREEKGKTKEREGGIEVGWGGGGCCWSWSECE